MNKLEVLMLLRELIQDATITKYADGDISGCNPTHFVDQEQLLKNIEHEIDQIEGKPGVRRW